MRTERGAEQDRRWRIGELARSTGLSVRALRHYDAIGLVRPIARSAAGYREYDGDDIRRLYRVLALRRLGLGLGEIRATLDAGRADLLGLVERQIERVELEMRLAGELRERLVGFAALLREPTTEAFDDELRNILEVIAMTNQYYTTEQLKQLEQRADALGPAGMQRAQDAWAALIAEAQSALEQGVDPASDEVQSISARWKELVEQFTGGDPGIRASLQRMYETEGPEAASRGAVSRDLMEYMARAQGAS